MCWWDVRSSCSIIMRNWPVICKIWTYNVRWPIISSTVMTTKSRQRPHYFYFFFSSKVKSRRFFGREFHFCSQWGLAFDVTMTTKGTTLANHNAKKLLETGVKRGKTRRANHDWYCFSLWLAEKVAWNFLCRSPIVTMRRSRDSEKLLETAEKSCSIVYLFIFLVSLQQAFNAAAAINRMKNLQLGSGSTKSSESNNNGNLS